MITEIEDFFDKGCGRCARFATAECSTRLWRDGLLALRRIAVEAGLGEVLKWGHPAYAHAGRNIAIIGAFRGDFRLIFFNAALLRDPEGLLQKQGPNTRHADCLKFADTGLVLKIKPVIRAYLAEAMGYADQGILPPKPPSALDLPAELVSALDADPELAEAFHALTPGRQKSYVILLAGAKAAATRTARIDRHRDRILAGKGANER